MRVFVGLGFIALLVGCRDSSYSSPTPAGAVSSGATADAAEEASTEEEPVFPIVVPADKETLNFQKQVELNTRYADEQICAFMDDMSPELAAERPEGLGCPRDEFPGAK